MISGIEITAPLAVAAFDELRADISKQNEGGVNAKQNSREFPAVEKTKSKKDDSVRKENAGYVPDFSDLAAKLRTFLDEENLAIEFSRDKETNKMIMKIIDSETNEIIRQYPPDITLKIARIVAHSLDQGQVTNARV